ncbi:MAG: hypothetical protein ABR521_02070 [Gaiellaceae bacterium]
MIFSLEALQADQGDSLLLHYGLDDAPRLIVVDGGPSGVYKRSLRPRLDELKQARSPDEPLPLQLVMVSHIDDDHVVGILDLTNQLVQERRDGVESAYRILALWHNSFDDLLGSDALAAAPAEVSALASGAGPADLPISAPARAVVASIGQGRALRDNAAALGLSGDPRGGDLLCGPKTFDWGEGLELLVVGPGAERLQDLQERWDEDVRKRKLSPTRVAGYLDRSVYNLSSLVVLVTMKGKTMLLTGDARGDDILDGLKAAGLLDKPPLEVDLLKLPHHGSDRNVETDFFRNVVADHYVVSSDGTDHNPEMAALRMISEARDDDDFALHLTNRTGKNDLGRRLAAFQRSERRRKRDYEIRFREDAARSITVDLLEPPGS